MNFIQLFAMAIDGKCAPSSTYQPQVAADLVLMERWIDLYPSGGNTFRMFRTEVERFYNWLYAFYGLRLVEVSADHAAAYVHFLADPPKEWCAHGSTRRHSASWRPLKGPLGIGSRERAIRSLFLFYAWLNENGHVSRNPFGRATDTQHQILQQRRSRSGPRRVLTRANVDALFSALSSLLKLPMTDKQRAKLERDLFVFQFILNTGCSGEDLRYLMNDGFVPLKVGSSVCAVSISDGVSRRQFFANTTAMEAVSRYRESMVGRATRGTVGTLLMPLTLERVGSRGMLVGTAQRLVKAALNEVAREVASSDRATAAVLSAAGVHTLQHTYVQLALDAGISPGLIQRQCGKALFNVKHGGWDGDTTRLIEEVDRVCIRMPS